MDGLTAIALLGDIGGGELLVVLAAVLFLFGGKKLPPIARSLGKMTDDIRRASQEFRDQLVNADRDDDSPSPNRLAPPPPQPGAADRSGQTSEPGEPDIAARSQSDGDPGKERRDNAG